MTSKLRRPPLFWGGSDSSRGLTSFSKCASGTSTTTSTVCKVGFTQLVCKFMAISIVNLIRTKWSETLHVLFSKSITNIVKMRYMKRVMFSDGKWSRWMNEYLWYPPFWLVPITLSFFASSKDNFFPFNLGHLVRVMNIFITFVLMTVTYYWQTIYLVLYNPMFFCNPIFLPLRWDCSTFCERFLFK